MKSLQRASQIFPMLLDWESKDMERTLRCTSWQSVPSPRQQHCKTPYKSGVDPFLDIEPFLFWCQPSHLSLKTKRIQALRHDYITHEDLSISSLLMVLFAISHKMPSKEAENLLLDWSSLLTNMTQYALLYSLTMANPFSSLRIAVSMLVHSDPIFQARGRLYSILHRKTTDSPYILKPLRFSEPNCHHQATAMKSILDSQCEYTGSCEYAVETMHSKTAEAQNIAIGASETASGQS